MRNERSLVKSINFHATFRCTSSEHADSFIKSGSIKFNTPASWVKYSIEKGEGRGDRLEGTIAMYHYLDIERMIELNDKYSICPNLIRMPFKEKVYLKNNRSMELPCYCLYILKHSLFEYSNKEGINKLVAEIPGSYFRDFMDNLSPQQVEKLRDEEKPTLIIITKFDEFMHRLLKYLLSIGLEESEIIVSGVTYFDFDKYGRMGWWDFGQEFPRELLIKNKRFENQSEVRIIINTNKDKVKALLSKPIEIGSMEDIATVHKEYFYDGIRAEMPANVALEE